MALALSTLRGTPTYSKDASTGNQWLSSGVLAPPSATAFDLPSGGTISIRVRTTSTGTIVSCGSDNGQSPGGFWLGIQNGLAAVAPGNGIGGVIIASTAAINDGAWHTLTLNVTSTGIEFLVDGSRATFKDGTPNPFTGVHAPFVWGKGTVAIGGLGAYTQFDWAGDIDAFSVVDSTGATIFATEFSDGGGATSPPATSGDTSVSTPAGPAEAFVQFKHLSGASKITVVTMTGSATYAPATLGATPTQAASVMFVQPASGGATATVNGAALNLNTAPNARTLVQLVPTANGYAPLYPTTTLVAPYGARPPLAPGCVRYKGATQPTDWLTNDTWEQTA